jgi:hypothetical protein
LHGGGEFLSVHEEIAVAGEHHHGAVGLDALGADACRHAVAHGA